MHMHNYHKILHNLKGKTPEELKLKLTFNQAQIMNIASFDELIKIENIWYIRLDVIHDRLIEAEQAAALIKGGYTQRKLELIRKEYSHALSMLRDITEFAIANTLLRTEGYNVRVD